MEWAVYGGFLAVTAVFVALELLSVAVGKGWTVSENLWKLQQKYGWKVRGPLLGAWLLLGSHIFLHIPK